MLAFIGLLVLAIVAYWVISSVVGFVTGFIGVLGTLLVWIVAGYLAGQLIRGKSYGIVGDTLLGLGGAIVGTVALKVVGVSLSTLPGGIITGVVGAVLLIGIVRLFHDSEFAR
jgi:uncharacterized membrane protein YeaQ/YmgE (transglycosylase-associated protein family)